MESVECDQNKAFDEEDTPSSDQTFGDSANMEPNSDELNIKDLSDLLCKPDSPPVPNTEELPDTSIEPNVSIASDNDVTKESSKDAEPPPEDESSKNEEIVSREPSPESVEQNKDDEEDEVSSRDDNEIDEESIKVLDAKSVKNRLAEGEPIDDVFQERNLVEDDSIKDKHQIEDDSIQEKDSVQDDSIQDEDPVQDVSTQNKDPIEDTLIKDSMEVDSFQDKDPFEDDSITDKDSVEDDSIQDKGPGENELIPDKDSVEDDSIQDKGPGEDELITDKDSVGDTIQDKNADENQLNPGKDSVEDDSHQNKSPIEDQSIQDKDSAEDDSMKEKDLFEKESTIVNEPAVDSLKNNEPSEFESSKYNEAVSQDFSKNDKIADLPLEVCDVPKDDADVLDKNETNVDKHQDQEENSTKHLDNSSVPETVTTGENEDSSANDPKASQDEGESDEERATSTTTRQDDDSRDKTEPTVTNETERSVNQVEKCKPTEEAISIDENSQDAEKNPDESVEDPDKEKDDGLDNNIEYVCLGDSIEEDKDAEKDAQSNSLETSENSNQIEENPLQDDNNKDDMLDDDPIGSDNFIVENQEGADEELCIIPDTERVISQAEKEAAFSIPPLRDISEATVSNEGSEAGNDISINDTTVPPNKFVVSKCNIEDLHDCVQCVQKRKAKYSVCKDGNTQYICSDECFENFKTDHTDGYILNREGEIRVKNLTNTDKELQSQVCFERKCVVCKKITDDEENNLTWEVMDFCNEYCLSKYQKEIGSVCSSCSTEVRPNSLGKYCVRFGNDIRQFCSSHCLEEYKKGLKVCSYCQRDMSGGSDGFLAPVGDKGQFKDFCSQLCMEKYDVMTNNRPPSVEEGTKCSVCKTENVITIAFHHEGTNHHFCSDRCFIAFSFVNNIAPSKCGMCRRYFSHEVLEKNTMFYDNVQYSFCSNSCQNIYIIAHRKIVPCVWCKVKKYNFDMIRRYFKTGPVLNMCSINCLSLFQVSVNAVNLKKTVCNFCNKRHQPMYHLTMSDATIRNFCSYSCVMSFQNKFKKSPITLNSDDQPVPTGEPKKNRKYALTESTPANAAVSPPLPVISSVQSLASKNGTYVAPTAPSNVTRTARTKTTTAVQTPPEPQIKIKHHIIIKPAAIPEQRNVSTMCKVRSQNKSTLIRPLMQDKGIQTDVREAEKILIPVPVPIYIPSPLPMYSIPVPYPLPFPIPIPVPVFIPTTRNSAKGIMKEIKKIQVKIPTDPYEAELLMMAEMVAGDKKEDHTESESDGDDNAAADETTFSPEPVDASNTFGDDMLQMALKMATELEEPAVDLDSALTANTITAPQGTEAPTEEPVEEPQPILQLPERQTTRGRKRGARGGRGGGSKRRRVSQPVEIPTLPVQPNPPPEPAEKPDAHLCLKYTFGVNAWKQWVATKNADLEKSSKYVKPLKTEILQLTADELNFSLCLFVKEVRKPNGAEYAPDTIYYLCLGIQQYLFENNRIDNIFCDPYYEGFTDSLDEIARKFSILYNDSHYIVTRVEEEHLWESKQLGAHSPHVLLSTLMFFNTKHFNLTTVQEHMQLSFSHIMKHWKRNPNQPGAARTPGSRNVLLRFYPPQSAVQNNARKKKVYEQQENDENPLRCPVKLYEFYLSKCPESVKTRNDVFYLQPERSCVPDSPVWYSTTALPQDALEKMLHRVKMVKEINVALLTS